MGTKRNFPHKDILSPEHWDAQDHTHLHGNLTPNPSHMICHTTVPEGAQHAIEVDG